MSKEGVSTLTPKLPFPHTDKGAVKTDPTLRVRDHPRVFALGDVSGSESLDPSTSGISLPATAQVLCLLCAISFLPELPACEVLTSGYRVALALFIAYISLRLP